MMMMSELVDRKILGQFESEEFGFTHAMIEFEFLI